MTRTQLTTDSVRFQNKNTQILVTPHRNTIYQYNKKGEPVSMYRVDKFDDGSKIIEVYGTDFVLTSRTIVSSDHITTYRYENNNPSPTVMFSAKKGQARIDITKF